MPCHLFLRLLFEPPENSWLCDGSPNGACQSPLRIGFRFRAPAPKIGTGSLALFTSGFGSKDDKGAQWTGTTTTMAMAARCHVCLVSSPIREPWLIGYGIRKKGVSAIGGHMKKRNGVGKSITQRRLCARYLDHVGHNFAHNVISPPLWGTCTNFHKPQAP